MSGKSWSTVRHVLAGLVAAAALSACGAKPDAHGPDKMSHDAMTAPATAPADVAPAATLGALSILAPVAHPPQGGQTTGIAYFTIRNGGDTPDRLLGATSAAANPVELHTHEMAGGVMKMMKVDAIDVPAKGEVALAPGGLHLMLFNFAAKDPRIVLHLKFEKAGEVDLSVPVEADMAH